MTAADLDPDVQRLEAERLPHGTNAGHKRHLRYGQVPCEPCAGAHKSYNEAHREGARYAGLQQDELFRQLLDLIAGECRRAGMLP